MTSRSDTPLTKHQCYQGRGGISGRHCNFYPKCVCGDRDALGKAPPSSNERATFIELLNLAEHFLAERQPESEENALRKRIADALTQAPDVETTKQYARDAEHCDYPDCESHWLLMLDQALEAMATFHATFSPADDADLTPRTSPKALRTFVDRHAHLLRLRSQNGPPAEETK